MMYSVKDVNISGESNEIIAIKLAIATLAWTSGIDNGNSLVNTLKNIPIKEVQELADDINKLNPNKAK